MRGWRIKSCGTSCPGKCHIPATRVVAKRQEEEGPGAEEAPGWCGVFICKCRMKMHISNRQRSLRDGHKHFHLKEVNPNGHNNQFYIVVCGAKKSCWRSEDSPTLATRSSSLGVKRHSEKENSIQMTLSPPQVAGLMHTQILRPKGTLRSYITQTMGFQ